MPTGRTMHSRARALAQKRLEAKNAPAESPKIPSWTRRMPGAHKTKPDTSLISQGRGVGVLWIV